jgi:hypothetical protein
MESRIYPILVFEVPYFFAFVWFALYERVPLFPPKRLIRTGVWPCPVAY